MMNFIWVHRHYTFEGKRVRVIRTFADQVLIQEVIPFTFETPRQVNREDFIANAVIIDEVP